MTASAADGHLENGSEDLITIRLLGFPLDLHARAQQQSEAMRREFRLVLEQAREHAGSVPARLVALSAELTSRYQGFSEEQEQRIEDGIATGKRQIDELVFVLPRHVRTAAQQLGEILDEADAFCRSDQLLTLATPPDLVAYRTWYLESFISQCDGAQPRPWTGLEPASASR